MSSAGVASSDSHQRRSLNINAFILAKERQTQTLPRIQGLGTYSTMVKRDPIQDRGRPMKVSRLFRALGMLAPAPGKG